MFSAKKNRRSFLKTAMSAAAGAGAYSLLSSCSSFDDLLFEDRYAFRDEVMIVGGGISGLYLAYKLRASKTEFRLFEGSSSFGGRIKSGQGNDYGASLLSSQDTLAGQLVKEMGIETKALDKEFYYLPAGMQAMTDELMVRILGLIPYRNFRLRWRLVEIEKQSSGYEVTFQHPNGRKRFMCKKIALAIPPTQWVSVKGLLDLPEMKWARPWLETLKVENTIRLIVPASAAPPAAKSLTFMDQDGLLFRQVLKKGKTPPTLEIDVTYLSKNLTPIDSIYAALRKKTQLNYAFQKLTPEQYFDWHQAQLIQGSYFRNLVPVPVPDSPYFQIIGDFTAEDSVYSIESALRSSKKASELFL